MTASSPRPTRRDLLLGALGLPLLAACGDDASGGGPAGGPAGDAGPRPHAGRAPPPPGARPPNLLFVFSDSHRAVSTGCYGNDDLATPALDAFAKQGVLLGTCISNTPVCRPYRASLMSGCHAHRTGMVSNQSPHNFAVDDTGQWTPPAGLPVLGEHLRRAGYHCGYIGKWHLGRIAVEPGPLRLGFDDHWYVARKPAHDYREWEYATGPGEITGGAGEFRTDHEVQEALGFIRDARARAPERPWALAMSWGPPHGPLVAPPGFEREHVVLPPNVTSPQARAVAARELPGYYGLIEALDASWRALMDGLDALGVAGDTLVVYTSDHGNQLGAQNLMGKEYAYSDSCRVPFLARLPGRIPAGLRVDAPVGTPDLLPTLCGMLGLPQPAGADGMDLSAALRGEPDAPVRDAVYLLGIDTELLPFPGWRAVRTERHLYARDENGPLLLHLCDEDPYELVNLVGRRDKAEAALDERLHAMMAELGDSWRPA